MRTASIDRVNGAKRVGASTPTTAQTGNTVALSVDATPYPCVVSGSFERGDAVLIWQGVVVGVHRAKGGNK